MLSQEELDKLLEGEGDDAAADAAAGNSSDSSADEGGVVSQDDIDALLSGDDDTVNSDAADAAAVDADGASDDSDIDWGDAFAEAAAGGDSAAAKAMDEGVVDEVDGESPSPSASAAASASQPAGSPKQDAPAAKFSNFSRDDSEVHGNANLDFILEIPLEVSVELGRAKMQIKDLLQLGQGSVVELNKMAGEPVDIYVNQKLLAKGEVVVMNEKFGVKLTEIISPADRVKSLG